MASDSGKAAAVLGGTGFLGHRIVAACVAAGFEVRAVSRHPGKNVPAGVSAVQADIQDPGAVRRALRGCQVAVNAVGLYVETAEASFEAVHVRGAADAARIAAEEEVERLVYISGVGSDRHSASKYVAARGRGEDAVRRANAGAIVVRPCVMFGEGGAFISAFDRIARASPVFPLFSDGAVRLQPVYAGDVAEAVAAIAGRAEPPDPVYEFGGPEILTYREIVLKVAKAAGRDPLLIPVPAPLWQALAAMSSALPNPPVTEGQVALLGSGNVVSGNFPGLAALGVTQKTVDRFLREKNQSRG